MKFSYSFLNTDVPELNGPSHDLYAHGLEQIDIDAERGAAAEAGAGAQDLAVIITQLERLAGLTQAPS